jgi:hypothetical protein
VTASRGDNTHSDERESDEEKIHRGAS